MLLKFSVSFKFSFTNSAPLMLVSPIHIQRGCINIYRDWTRVKGVVSHFGKYTQYTHFKEISAMVFIFGTITDQKLLFNPCSNLDSKLKCYTAAPASFLKCHVVSGFQISLNWSWLPFICDTMHVWERLHLPTRICGTENLKCYW